MCRPVAGQCPEMLAFIALVPKVGIAATPLETLDLMSIATGTPERGMVIPGWCNETGMGRGHGSSKSSHGEEPAGREKTQDSKTTLAQYPTRRRLAPGEAFPDPRNIPHR